MDVGLYGKLPTHGDFLRRRAADDFVTTWDAWLQQCLADSRVALGDKWLDTYLTSPVWRFALAPQVCGAAAVAGLLVPSVDRVGRYFPLTLVWCTPTSLSTLDVALRFRVGFDRAERLLLDTLAAEQFEFADFDRSVMELSAVLENPDADDALRMVPSAARSLTLPIKAPRCLPIKDTSALATPALQMLGGLLDASGPVGLWWTDGSSVVDPSWLMTRGLPEANQYTAMIDGAWTAAGWAVTEPEADPTRTTVRPHLDLDTAQADAMIFQSAAYSDKGPVRSTNQDSFIERPDRSLWAVADGMGGLSEGDVASRMVCDSLANAPFLAGLDEQVESAVGQLREVNAYLRRNATRDVNPVQSGSTVVALLIRRKECAVIWAGDSRVYRWRDGALSQLTTDHSWNAAQDGAGVDDDDQAITRAVGGEDTLLPDTLRSDVRPGDRFMLCSDGVHRVLDPAVLGKHLQIGEPTECCQEMIAAALALGSTDNVTAIVVDCGALPAAPALTEALDIFSL